MRWCSPCVGERPLKRTPRRSLCCRCVTFMLFQWTHPLEAAREVRLALHHVEEDGDGGLAQLYLRNQSHLQHGAHHLWDEFNLVST